VIAFQKQVNAFQNGVIAFQKQVNAFEKEFVLLKVGLVLGKSKGL